MPVVPVTNSMSAIAYTPLSQIGLIYHVMQYVNARQTFNMRPVKRENGKYRNSGTQPVFVRKRRKIVLLLLFN